jgi:predicted kinase
MSKDRATPRLVVMSGLPGSGKSTLAEALARSLGLPVLSVDPIESAMLRAGIAKSFETGLAAYLVVETVADAQLGLGQGAIIDAVNAEEEGKEIWRELGQRRGVPLRIIECACSDTTLHQRRLATRQRGLDPAFREPSWEDVERRRLAYTRWREPVLAIDTAAPTEASLARALRWLADEA